MIRSRLIILVLLLLPLPALGAPPLFRPYAGRGLLIIPAAPLSVDAIIYEYPGVRRKGTIPVAELPSLSPAISLKGGEIAVATVAVREGYVRVAMAPSGEAQWLELRPTWRTIPWERFLTGRSIRLPAGLRESASRLRESPSETGAVLGTASAGSSLVVSEIRDDWAQVLSKGTLLGWLRWRDGDGRLLVTVE